MIPDYFTAYPSALRPHDPGADAIKSCDVLWVTEKLDGSQFAFMSLDGKLHCRSKGRVIEGDGDALFAPAIATARRLFDGGRLREGYVYYCETLHKPKHSTLAYASVPPGSLAMFGLRRADATWADPDGVAAAAAMLGVGYCPVVFFGAWPKVEQFLSRDPAESCLGGTPAEGYVVRGPFDPMRELGRITPFRSVKYVSERFKEVHKRDWSADNTPQGAIDALVESFKSEARWRKAVGRLAESGKLTRSVKDIGALIRSVRDDVLKEEGDFVRAKLVEILMPGIVRRISNECTHGLPEWYRRELAEGGES